MVRVDDGPSLAELARTVVLMRCGKGRGCTPTPPTCSFIEIIMVIDIVNRDEIWRENAVTQTIAGKVQYLAHPMQPALL